MLEMSVENETVVAGDGGGGVLSHLHAPKDMHPPKLVPGGEPVTPLLASVGLTEGGTMGVCVGTKPLQPKNGLQATQPGPQKLGKRRYSMNVSVRPAAGPAKRRRRASESQPVLPSHFLLGGNIFDPLNLNSLLDEEVSRALNAHTPETSPLPAKGREPLEILVPKDITDPLNLSGCSGGGGDAVLLSPLKRRRHRNRHHGAGPPEHAEPEKGKPAGGESGVGGVLRASAVQDEPRGGAVLLGLNQAQDSPQPYELNTSINCRDEVVPPILPRRHSQSGPSSALQPRPPGSTDLATSGHPPSRSRKRRRTVSRSERLSITPTPTVGPSSDRASAQTFQTPIVGGAKGSLHPSSSQPSQKPRKPQRKYQYGNYSRFYGYRRPSLLEDPRLSVLKPEWFRRKKVLDLGCNTGHVTLAIAKHWNPTHILGLDIDGGLIRAARQNLRHYLSEVQPRESQSQSAQHNMADRLKQEVPQQSVARAREAGKEGNHLHKDGKGVGGVFAALMDLQLTATSSAAQRPFLLSFRLCRGPITAPLLPETSQTGFPYNVFFMKVRF